MGQEDDLASFARHGCYAVYGRDKGKRCAAMRSRLRQSCERDSVHARAANLGGYPLLHFGGLARGARGSASAHEASISPSETLLRSLKLRDGEAVFS
jgi:hypothetical protein